MSGAAQRPRAAAAPPTPERSGLLAVDKSAGMTSHDVVMRVRRRLGAPGAGHLGTLDPAATGLLLVALGAATRCVTLWQGGEKTYEATVRFGLVTASQDLDGEVLETRPVTVTEDGIRAASARFLGDIEQLPPMVSAVRVGGERLHRLARRGVTVERPARRVHIAEWTWLGFELPEARFRVRCSSGTYVRTLAHDLGQALGCGAALAGLRRLRSEPFGLDRAVTLAELDTLDPAEAWARGGLPLAGALAHLAQRSVTEAEAARIGRGHPLDHPAASEAAPGETVVLVDAAGVPLALATVRHALAGADRRTLQPHVVFPWAVREGPA